ncbi:unnamed protein product, partial [Meganyctiphanes norvegica]
QVWFQNRRAKFRRNERSVVAQRSPTVGFPRPQDPTQQQQQQQTTVGPVEQPLAPRHSGTTAMSMCDYSSYNSMGGWKGGTGVVGSPTTPYLPHFPPATSPTPMCPSLTPGLVNSFSGGGGGGQMGGYMGSSLASLRLRAQEYNLHQGQV